MQRIVPCVGEVYRRNGVFKEGVELRFNDMRWHSFVVNSVTPTHVYGSIITQLILEAGEGCSFRLADFTGTFFETAPGSNVLSRSELIGILQVAQNYLDLFGVKWEPSGDGLLSIEAIGLAGLPREIALVVGRQIRLAAVRSFRDILPEYATLCYQDAFSNTCVAVDISVTHYSGDSPCYFDASHSNAIEQLISWLYEF